MGFVISYSKAKLVKKKKKKDVIFRAFIVQEIDLKTHN